MSKRAWINWDNSRMALLEHLNPASRWTPISVASLSASIWEPPIHWWLRCATVCRNVCRDAQGRAILPSVVRYLPDGGRQIGHEALAAVATDPENTIASVKRFMGAGCRHCQPRPVALRVCRPAWDGDPADPGGSEVAGGDQC